jgi:hypothetical protein
MSAEAVANLTDQILAERGGRQAFTFTQLAIAHQLGSALTSPADSTTATTVARLTEMLPPVVTDDAPAWDLTKLSDRQFAMLEKLAAVATGQASPPRLRKPPLPPETPRTIRARELADLLDKADSEGRPLSESDLLQCRSHLSGLLGLLCTMSALVPPEIYGVPSKSRPDTLIEPERVTAYNSSEAAPPPSNVVKLPLPEEQRALRYGAVYIGNDNPSHF